REHGIARPAPFAAGQPAGHPRDTGPGIAGAGRLGAAFGAAARARRTRQCPAGKRAMRGALAAALAAVAFGLAPAATALAQPADAFHGQVDLRPRLNL